MSSNFYSNLEIINNDISINKNEINNIKITNEISYNYLNEKIDLLEDDLKDNINLLDNQVSNINSQITNINTEVSNINSNVNNLGIEIDNLKIEVDNSFSIVNQI